MDSVLLSQPAPSHSSTAAAARQRVLFDSISDARRSGPYAHDHNERSNQMVEESFAGQSSNRRLGRELFGDHAERSSPGITGRRAMLPSCYAPSRYYVPISSQPVAAGNHWGDQEMSSRSEGLSQSERDERARGRRSRRRHIEPVLPSRSCTSIMKQRHLKRKVYTLITAGIFFLVVLAIYIAFTASHARIGRELHILLIFMLLIIAIVFCHSFVRFILAIARGSSVHVRNRILSRMGTGGYAEPDRPIPVVLAADEEIMAESNGASPTTQEKLTAPPPAYGLWRSSVRINPDLLYWQRVDDASAARRNTNGKPTAPRPPSYASDDGVEYVVEAQPRSLVQEQTQGCQQDRIPETSSHPQHT